MAAPRTRILGLRLLLLLSAVLSVVQAQFYISEACQQSCVSPVISQPDVDGRAYVCSAQGFQQYQSCVCTSCPSTDLPEVNRMVRTFCSDAVPGQAGCFTSSSSSSSQAPVTTSRTSNPTTLSTIASSPTPATGAGSSSDDTNSNSSSTSSTSSRRKGSKAGVKAGIAVGVVAAILIILGLFYFIIDRLKFIKMQKEKATSSGNEQQQNASDETAFTKQELDATEKSPVVSDDKVANTGDGDGEHQLSAPQFRAEMSAEQADTLQQHRSQLP